MIRRLLSRAQVQDPFLFTSFYEFMRHISYQLYFLYAVKKLLVVIVCAEVVVSRVVKLSQGVYLFQSTSDSFERNPIIPPNRVDTYLEKNLAKTFLLILRHPSKSIVTQPLADTEQGIVCETFEQP